MEFVIYFNRNYQKIREEYGWFVEAKNQKELAKRFDEPIVKVVVVKKTDPLKVYNVRFEFWHYSEPFPKQHDKKFIARNEAEAMYLLREFLDETQGTFSILDVEEAPNE